jgi:hypothetical protein
MAMRSKRNPVDPLPTGLARHPITRRQLLRAAGAGVAGVSLASLLAACGDDGGSAAEGGASPSG